MPLFSTLTSGRPPPHIHTCGDTHADTHTHMHVHTYMHTHTHVRTHMYTHARTHARARALPPGAPRAGLGAVQRASLLCNKWTSKLCSG